MHLQDFQSGKIGVLGFGKEGQAVLAYLNKHGFLAAIFDEKPQEEWSDEAKALAVKSGAEIITGENYLDSIHEYNLLFRSPGVWRRHPQILFAEASGTVITSQTKWFFEHTKATIIGVTGTKGKGTTSSLIYETLKAAGKTAYLTGNIGKTQPLEFMDNATSGDFVVYELSSFQLQDLTQSPHIGICLMVTSDHLDHHNDIHEYHEAKSAITAFQDKQDIAIFNADYPASKVIGNEGKGKKLIVSAKTQPKNGAIILNNVITFIRGNEEIRIDCSDRKLRGAHNLENIAASGLACLELGIDKAIVGQTANDFAGLEHRLQYLGSFDGAGYYNDSISTVPETTIAAVRAFSEPIHLLLGGSDKGLSYDGLVEFLSQQSNIASITLLGETGKKIKSLLDHNSHAFEVTGPFTDFSEAVKEAKSKAKQGDVVLLSPASASFDMFQNYADRGNQFAELVKLTN